MGKLNVNCHTIGQHSWLSPIETYKIVGLRQQRIKLTTAEITSSYVQDKYHHTIKNIAPKLSSGIVLADRWVHSDIAYHYALYSVPMEHTIAAQKACGVILPSIVIYLRTPVELAYERIIQRGRIAQHYERPAELNLIQRAYNQLLIESNKTINCQVVVVDNITDIDTLRRLAFDIAKN